MVHFTIVRRPFPYLFLALDTLVKLMIQSYEDKGSSLTGSLRRNLTMLVCLWPCLTNLVVTIKEHVSKNIPKLINLDDDNMW